MNKLTEIKKKVKEIKGLKGAMKKAIEEGYSDVGVLGYKLKLSATAEELAELMLETDLLSLLEEKDKALTEIAKKETYYDRDSLIHTYDEIKNIACKALNTSSNSEGE